MRLILALILALILTFGIGVDIDNDILDIALTWPLSLLFAIVRLGGVEPDAVLPRLVLRSNCVAMPRHSTESANQKSN